MEETEDDGENSGSPSSTGRMSFLWSVGNLKLEKILPVVSDS
jgi:hypothetical protein